MALSWPTATFRGNSTDSVTATGYTEKAVYVRGISPSLTYVGDPFYSLDGGIHTPIAQRRTYRVTCFSFMVRAQSGGQDYADYEQLLTVFRSRYLWLTEVTLLNRAYAPTNTDLNFWSEQCPIAVAITDLSTVEDDFTRGRIEFAFTMSERALTY
jgi:hypothetical protein